MDSHNKMTRDFRNKLQALLARKANHKCMYPGCTEPAINAHAISKEYALRGIAKDGILIHPEPLRSDEDIYCRIKFCEVGIQKASTFKGFCKTHDATFGALDKTGINTLGEVFLQLYRSFANIVFVDNAYLASARYAGDHENFNQDFELSKPISASRGLSLSYDLLDGYNNSTQQLPPYDKLKLTPFSSVAGMNADVLIRRIHFPCPVALHKRFVIREEGIYHDTFVFVVPSATTAMMIIVCDPKYTKKFFAKVHTDIDTLNFIESCMICDGDWWMDPAVMKKWSAAKLDILEGDYWNFHEISFLNQYDISIFDDIRTQLCVSLSAEERDREFRKIYTLPKREDIFLRQVAFSMKVHHDKRDINKKFPGGNILD